MNETKKSNRAANKKVYYYKGFSRIDKIISLTAKERNLEAPLFRHKTLKYWNQVAAAFVEEAKDLTQAVDFKKGVLTVACLSQEVVYKLKLQAQKIIGALNQMLGRQVVYAIYFEM